MFETKWISPSFLNKTLMNADAVSQVHFQTCTEAADRYYHWVVILLVVPVIINCCSLALLITTIIHVRQLKSVTEAITSSTHWLARTATRVGLGMTVQKALMEYARRKNLIKLIPRNEQGEQRRFLTESS